jgi:hypothetical protein
MNILEWKPCKKQHIFEGLSDLLDAMFAQTMRVLTVCSGGLTKEQWSFHFRMIKKLQLGKLPTKTDMQKLRVIHSTVMLHIQLIPIVDPNKVSTN